MKYIICTMDDVRGDYLRPPHNILQSVMHLSSLFHHIDSKSTLDTKTPSSEFFFLSFKGPGSG